MSETMSIDVYFVPVIVAIALIVPVAAVALMNRGKRLKCPKCGRTFKAPLMDEKHLGFGYTFPYMGCVTCPQCKTTQSRRDYDKVIKPET
jgi:hypothetical protein